MRSFFYLLIFILVSSTTFIASASEYIDNTEIKSQKAILVTGASSGIGEQIAITLSKNGYYVYAGARKGKDIDRLNKIENMQGIRLDVTKPDQIIEAVEHITKEGRGLYGLVNNAGVFLFDPLIEISEGDMQFIFDVNVMGPYRVTKAFAPLIIQSKGRITTTGSVAGLFSSQMFGPYGMTKHAVEAFTDALAQEMKKFGVSVSIIEPGNFRSNIMQNMQNRLDAIDKGEHNTQYRDEISRMASFTKADRSHHASPEPVAEAALHFMDSERPKLRYLVTPNQQEADFAINRYLLKLVDLNADHDHSKSNEELGAMLNKLLTGKKQ